MPRTSPDSKSPRRRLSARAGVVAIATIVLVAAAIGWSVWRSDDVPPPTQVPDSQTTTPTIESIDREVGQPVDTGSFLIEVLSAGPSDLPVVNPDPKPGHHFLGVNVQVVNQGDSGVPLNGLPYRATTAMLLADGGEYSGGLYVRPGLLLDGTVPPGVPIAFQFMFEIPDDSAEATFVWAPVPAVTGYPRIVVTLPESALQPK